MKELTIRQKTILKYISDYIRANGYSPTVREIGKAMNLNSTCTVWHHLDRLKEKGYIDWKWHTPRSLKI